MSGLLRFHCTLNVKERRFDAVLHDDTHELTRRFDRREAERLFYRENPLDRVVEVADYKRRVSDFMEKKMRAEWEAVRTGDLK